MYCVVNNSTLSIFGSKIHLINFNLIIKCIKHILIPSEETCSQNSGCYPLHKKKEVTNPENYRPISLLSSDSKITEQAIYLQLVQYLENNNLIHPAHHGFSSGHKTTTALLQMHDQ